MYDELGRKLWPGDLQKVQLVEGKHQDTVEVGRILISGGPHWLTGRQLYIWIKHSIGSELKPTRCLASICSADDITTDA